jgi:hypothetical protein
VHTTLTRKKERTMGGPPPDRLRPPTCPSWCIVRHGTVTGEDDHVHVGGALLVRHTVLRLAATIDPHTGVVDGPHVLAGSEEYSLHEADALIDALTQLVEAGTQLASPA